MWILVKETFAGVLAGESIQLVAGIKYDLSKDKIEQLRKKIGEKNVVNTIAPWEEHVDQKAVKHNEFLAKVHKAITDAEKLKVECEQIADSIDTLQQQFKQKQKDMDNAAKETKKLAKAAGIDWPASASSAATRDDGPPKDAGKSEG